MKACLRGALAEMQAGPGEKTMDNPTSGGLPARVPAGEPETEEPLGLSELPTELLEMVLSHVPPHVLLGRCRRVWRRWRALVDCQALWLNILARDHAALWPVVSTCLPPAADPWWCHKKKQVLDLEKEGFWPELLDSGKMEICVSDWWAGRQDTDNIYHLIIQLLDCLLPIWQWRNNVSFEVNHVFSNFKKGVRFVSCEHWVQDVEFLSEHYGVYLPNSSVIVRVRLS
ncbi:F-box only protein 27-like [Megaptera novaeangliae]